MWLNAQTPEVLNLKKLIEQPYHTDVGLAITQLNTCMKAKPNRKTGVAGKNSHNCVKTHKKCTKVYNQVVEYTK